MPQKVRHYLGHFLRNKIQKQLSNQWEKDHSIFEPYKQVFDDREGFLNNLRIWNLLFNDKFTIDTIDYLKNQKINISKFPNLFLNSN
jgi:hypothetical protein